MYIGMNFVVVKTEAISKTLPTFRTVFKSSLYFVVKKGTQIYIDDSILYSLLIAKST